MSDKPNLHPIESYVEERLYSAARTLRRLPDAKV